MFSWPFASPNVVRNLITIFRIAGRADVETAERAATWASFARFELHLQAYARKHRSFVGIVNCAMKICDENRFHACRVIAK